MEDVGNTFFFFSRLRRLPRKRGALNPPSSLHCYSFVVWVAAKELELSYHNMGR